MTITRRSATRYSVLLAPLVWGLAGAWLMPRGPVSTAEALLSLGISLLVGLACGWVLRSRWTLLLAPAAFLVAYELARIQVSGPSVDRPVLSTYGIVALVTGRLFHGLLTVLPMLVGVGIGRALQARGHRQEVARQWPGRLLLTAGGASVVLVAAFVARPASTPPITDASGEPLAGSVAELTRVEVNGHDLGLMIRGHDTNNPVLLFLAGGPGGSELGAMRRHLPELERYFTVATLDQRGTGRSYGSLDPVDTMTVQAAVADVLAVRDHLVARLGQDRVYLVGQSWGTLLGVLSVQQAPERFAAFVGVGQMVAFTETDRMFYDDKLAWARATGQDALAARLVAVGPPPYVDPRHYELALAQELEVHPYDHAGNSEGMGQMSENLFVAEYSLTEQIRLLGATMDTFAALYPKVQDIDLRATATELTVPVFFVQGAHEAPGRAVPFEQWYSQLRAPAKDRIVLATSGHRPMFEQPGEFVAYLRDVVLPATSAATGA